MKGPIHETYFKPTKNNPKMYANGRSVKEHKLTTRVVSLNNCSNTILLLY